MSAHQSNSVMPYEVELKFPLADVEAIRTRLARYRAQPVATVEQSDLYFQHPARDFGQTDEAFRIRRVDQRNYVTYKGPLVDRETKTRQEIEIAFAEGPEAAERLETMLTQLGFSQTRGVHKVREVFSVAFDNHDLELSLDHVTDLGDFIEIEIVTDEQHREAARDCILRFAAELGLENSERRSYLCLLMAQDEQGKAT